MAGDFPYVYPNSRAEAHRHKETQMHEDSFRLNVDCARAIEQAIRGLSFPCSALRFPRFCFRLFVPVSVSVLSGSPPSGFRFPAAVCRRLLFAVRFGRALRILRAPVRISSSRPAICVRFVSDYGLFFISLHATMRNAQ